MCGVWLARAAQQQRGQEAERGVEYCDVRREMHGTDITSFIASGNGLLLFAQAQRPQHIAGQGITQEQPEQYAGRIAGNQDEKQGYQEDHDERHTFAHVQVLEAVERQVADHAQTGEHRQRGGLPTPPAPP